MIIPIIFAILAATLYASGTHMDRYLLTKVIKNANYRSLILVSTIIAGGVMSIIYLFVCGFQFEFDLPTFLLLTLSSISWVAADIFWFKAIARHDASIIAIMSQMILVFLLLLSPILLPGQNISLLQLVGGFIIMIAAVCVTFDPKRKKFGKAKLITFVLMILASVFYALWYILERHVNLTHDFNQTIFWSYFSLFLVGVVIFIFIKSYRSEFIKLLKTSGKKVIAINLANEVFNAFGNVSFTFASTMASVALVSFVSYGAQPFIVLIIGAVLTALFPKIGKENVTKSIVIGRIVLMILCLTGIALIEFG